MFSMIMHVKSAYGTRGKMSIYTLILYFYLMISDGIEKVKFVITIWKNIDGRGAQLPLSSSSNQSICT